MMFARTFAPKGTGASNGTCAVPEPLHRPMLLMLTNGDDLGHEEAAAAEDAGFRVAVVPWFAVAFRLHGIAALSGYALDGGGVPRPLAAGEWLEPEAMASSGPLDLPALRVAATIGRFHPRMVLGIADCFPPAGTSPAAEARGVIALAPDVVLAAGDEPGAVERLQAIAGFLTRVPAGASRFAFDDPRCVVLPVQAGRAENTAMCGFRAGHGQPFQADLFAIWVRVVRGRLPPPPPLSMPAFGFPTAGAPAEIHPLAAFLPCPADGHAIVHTRARADASFAFLDPGLTLSSGPVDNATLLRLLGRTIDPAAPADPEGDRLAEPGVGRAVLVHGLSLPGRPDFVDFTALGVGITPYAEGGYVNVGRRIDGKAGLDRSVHRKDCAARLEAAGCRAGAVVAVIGLAESAIDLEHAQSIPAGIAVRGFRCVMRVKQLDPIVAFLHSHQHAPAAHDAMMHARWSRVLGLPAGAERPDDPAAAVMAQQLLLGLETYAARCSLAELAAAAFAPPPFAGLAAALTRRLAAIRQYAPHLLALVRTRLAVELNRDPVTDRPGNREYTEWFAETMGTQLAIFRKIRFLHDYHHEGVARSTPGQIYSLGENNVSLMAEFPDLDTGIFLDRPDPAQLDTLFLTRADFDVLADGFPAFHQRDVAEAMTVARTLAFVALDGDPGGIIEAERRFSAAYHRELDSGA